MRALALRREISAWQRRHHQANVNGSASIMKIYISYMMKSSMVPSSPEESRMRGQHQCSRRHKISGVSREMKYQAGDSQ